MNTRAIEAGFDRVQNAIRQAFVFLSRKAEALRAPGSRQFPGLNRSEVILASEQVQELELLAESLHIDKERIAEGDLTIRKEAITETQVISVPVIREELVIERRSRNGSSQIDVLAGLREVRIPVSRERVIVRKEPVVSEIVKVSKRRISETRRVTSEVLHEELKVQEQGRAVSRTENGKKAA
jgi:uncharacterized protein (TIGR02271 family)